MDTPRSILDVTPQTAESMSRDALHAVADAEIEAEHKRLKEREKCGALLSFPEVSSWEGNRDVLLMLLNIALPFLAPWFWFLKLKVAAIIQMVICAPLFIVALLSGDSSPYFFSCFLAGALCTFVVAAWFALCAIGDLIERARYGFHIRSAVSNVKGNPFRVLREEVPVGNFKERVFYEKFLSWASVREARYDELLRIAAPTIDLGAAVSAVQQAGAKLGETLGVNLEDAKQLGGKLKEKLGESLQGAQQAGAKLGEKLGEGLQDAKQVGAKLGEKLGVNLEDVKQLGGKLKEKLRGRSAKG